MAAAAPSGGGGGGGGWDVPWEEAAGVARCPRCERAFGLLLRRHHCRGCGRVHCDRCTPLRVPLPPCFAASVRCCRPCFARAYCPRAEHGAGGPAARLAAEFPGVDASAVAALLEAGGGSEAEARRYLREAAAASAGPAAPGPQEDEEGLARVANRLGQLTQRQTEQFYRDGFLHLAGVVPLPAVEAARGAINDSMRRGINVAGYHTRALAGTDERRTAFCPDAGGSPEVLALYRASPVRDLVAALLGRAPRPPPDPAGAQVALVFPRLEAARAGRRPGGAHPSAWFNGPRIRERRAWHIDGLDRGDAVPARVGNFSLLVGVYLSDATAPFRGNLTVFPGAHHQMQAWVRQNGGAAAAGARLLADGVPSLDLPEPRQVLAAPGDVVLASYHLPHAVAPNCGPDTRYATYFRVTAPRPEGADASLANMWLDFRPLWDLAEANEGGVFGAG